MLSLLAILQITGTLGALPNYPMSRREMEVSAGYYTESGKYLGGFPHYVEVFEFYECTAYTSDKNVSATTINTTERNATVCMTWTANMPGSEVYDGVNCSCQSLANAAYCSEWTCRQQDVATTTCTCETADADSQTFCSSWACREENSDGAQGIGEYQCLTASSNPDLCEAWTGVYAGSKKVESSTCACAEQQDRVEVCSSWSCQERHLVKCSRGGTSWCNIRVSIGVGCFFGSFGAMLIAFGFNSEHKCIQDCSLWSSVTTGFIWMVGWFGGVVVWGGQDGAVCAGIAWGAIIASGLLYRCLCNYRYRSTKSLASYRGRSSQQRVQQDESLPN